MQWNFTFIRMPGISNAISIQKSCYLGHVVQKLENAKSRTRDITLSADFTQKLIKSSTSRFKTVFQTPKP